MQDTTKRYFMESLSIALVTFAVILNTSINVFLILRTLKFNVAVDKILHEYPDMIDFLYQQNNSTDDKVDFLIEDQKNAFLELKTFFSESIPPKTPIRPNNWDSVKEAFKGPTKVKIDE